MSSTAMMAVLVGAALHASWNAIVKGGRDTLVDTALVATGGALISLAAVPFLPLPAAESWPYLAASVVVHVGYFLLVAAAYRTGDMSYAYPLMRGSAPLLVALASAALIGERPSPAGWLGILVISGGVIGLAAAHRATRPAAGSAGRPAGPAARFGPTAFALANAVVIAVYTLLDGIGARLSGDAVAYTAWLLALTGPPLLLLVARQRGRALAQEARRRWPVALVGGACTLGSYGLALWAMTQAPVALVAALRETSILFGTGLAVLFLRERVGWTRYGAAAAIALGAVTLRLA